MSEYPSVARIILSQLGGIGRLAMMVGAKRFVDCGQAVQFDLGKGSKNKATKIRVELNGNDYYDVTFYKVRGIDCKVVGEVKDVGAEELVRVFEGETGMYLSF